MPIRRRPIAIEFDAKRETFSLVYENTAENVELLSEALTLHGEIPCEPAPQDATREGVTYS